MYSLDGDVAVITGAARGIGRAAAERLLAEGARVAMCDVDREAGAAALEALLARYPEKVSFAPADVSDPKDAERVVAATLERWGQIDILVNNAGIAGRSVPTWELTDEDWHRVLRITLDGVFYFTRAVIPHMRSRRYGRIVNIASIAGKEGNPNAVPYSAAKAAVIGLTKAVAKEVAGDGILINSVAPAVIETSILEQVSEEHRRYMLARIPMGRAGQPEEVAALIAWLSSRECSFSTGACYDISGGRATY